jgi:hypothetical protein
LLIYQYFNLLTMEMGKKKKDGMGQAGGRILSPKDLFPVFSGAQNLMLLSPF